IAGLPRIRIRIRPLFEYGSARAGRTIGSNHLRFAGPEHALRVTTDAPIAFLESESAFALTQAVHLVYGPDEPFEASVRRTTLDFYARTHEYWVEWVRYLAVPFEWQDEVIRAAITLKLCAFEETGGIVAALTTSVPEAPSTPRTW